jgi:translation elongation factor EF-G
MNDDRVACFVTVPEWWLGITAGKLNRRRALLEDRSDSGTSQIIRTRIPREELEGFREWLAKSTEGTGRVEII